MKNGYNYKYQKIKTENIKRCKIREYSEKNNDNMF